jgi:hypothetical protein
MIRRRDRTVVLEDVSQQFWRFHQVLAPRILAVVQEPPVLGNNRFRNQGAKGYGQRFGAAYAGALRES